MTEPANQVWVSLPCADESQIPRLYDGDSYCVRRANGEELWANFVLDRGAYFVPCDDDGAVMGPALRDVVAVQVSRWAFRQSA